VARRQGPEAKGGEIEAFVLIVSASDCAAGRCEQEGVSGVSRGVSRSNAHICLTQARPRRANSGQSVLARPVAQCGKCDAPVQPAGPRRAATLIRRGVRAYKRKRAGGIRLRDRERADSGERPGPAYARRLGGGSCELTKCQWRRWGPIGLLTPVRFASTGVAHPAERGRRSFTRNPTVLRPSRGGEAVGLLRPRPR
jgi:hypothetical protein